MALFTGLASAQSLGIHPDFTMTNLRPTGFDPMVGGLDFLPDGRLVVATWEGFGAKKGSVYLVSNAQTGDASKITYKKFASNLNEPLGVSVVDGEIYLLQKDQLSYLPDKNKDGLADTVKKVASGWTVQPAAQSLEFALGMVYKDSVFWGGLATAWPLDGKQSNDRGCIIQMSLKTGNFSDYACGFRTPNGFTIGPDNEIFVMENQGNWVPSSKLINVKKGHFYGVHKSNPGPGPFNDQPETPPAVWIDYKAIGISPTQPVFLKTGTFKGQMLAGDNNMGTLQRYFLEKVGGEFQGAVFPFSGGLQAATNRIIVGPDSAVYIGGIGTQEWGGWDWAGKNFGLQRMAPNGKKSFDILAIRSKGPTTMEMEFTTPVGTGADKVASYQVKQWFYKPELTYGAGKQPVYPLTVNSVKVSDDKLKVTLDIAGMLVKNVVYIKLNSVKAANNDTLWSTEAWYTQNAFGPGTDVTVSLPPHQAKISAKSNLKTRGLGDGRVALDVEGAGAFTLEIHDTRGRLEERHVGTGSMSIVSDQALDRGIHLISLKDANGTFSKSIVGTGVK